MATKRYPKSVVVLDTHVGFPLVIRANPTIKAVRGFVEEHTLRYIEGRPGGPSGIPAYKIFNAKRYASEDEYLSGAEPVAEIKIDDLVTP